MTGKPETKLIKQLFYMKSKPCGTRVSAEQKGNNQWMVPEMDILEYFQKVWESVKPLYAIFATAISYIIFPDDAYIGPAIGVAGAMVLDIITKYYALSKLHGGLWNAVRQGHINSNKLWRGTYKKVVSYLVIAILAGLSYRVTPIVKIATFMSTLVYSIMFLREAQSSVENLIQAGHTDIGWLLSWLRRKEQSVMKESEQSTEE